jgi:hypothetical protein
MGFLSRFVSWLFDAPRAPRPTSDLKRAEEQFLVPMLFAPPGLSIPDRQTKRTIGFSPAPRPEPQPRSLAARMNSVARENVPKTRKGRRARIAPPTGKAVPKKMAPVLKSYKQSSGVPATAPWTRKVHVPARAENVVTLEQMLKQPSAERGFFFDRIAA